MESGDGHTKLRRYLIAPKLALKMVADKLHVKFNTIKMYTKKQSKS